MPSGQEQGSCLNRNNQLHQYRMSNNFAKKKKKRVKDYIGPQAGHGQKHHAVVKKANIMLCEVVLLLAIGKSVLGTLLE